MTKWNQKQKNPKNNSFMETGEINVKYVWHNRIESILIILFISRGFRITMILGFL